MSIIDSFKNTLTEFEIKDEKGGISFKRIVAERKAFLSTKKLEYSGKIRVNEETKEVTFSDMLKESGNGFTLGSDSGMSSGFGFSASTYSSGMSGNSGTIEEQSNLFGKQYSYNFKYEEVRNKIKGICETEGYKFNYSIF
jgi:hypothetical protein